MPANFEPHELCALFPNLDEAEYNALRDSIAAVGLLEPITRLDGQILDGLHRYQACCELGIAATFVEFAGADPLEFVLARNLHRRHLDESQRALVAGRIATMRQGARTDLAQICAKSQAEAAERLGVSRRSVQSAAAVLGAGIPELQRAIERREASVSAAAAVARLPQDEQREIVARGEIAPAAKRVRAKRAAPADQTAGRVQALEEELERVRDGAQEAVAQAEAAHEVLNGDPAKAILRLREQLRVTELRRDELMRENAELKREVKRLQRKLGLKQ